MLQQANIQALASQLKFFGTVVLIIGFLCMAILQTIKDLLPWRRSFQKRCMIRWLADGVTAFRQTTKFDDGKPPEELLAELQESYEANSKERQREHSVEDFLQAFLNAKELLREYPRNRRAATLRMPWDRKIDPFDSTVIDIALFDLAKLATAGDEKALYNLPIEQLCGQVNAALQLALENPSAHVVLLWCMGHFASSTDFDDFLNPPLTELHKVQNDISVDRVSLDTYATARTRVSQKLQRGVDGFQIAAGNHWKLILQVASIVLSMLLAIIALMFPLGIASEATKGAPITFLHTLENVGQDFLIVVGIGLAGGFIAPIARDLLAVLQRLRT